MQGLNRFFEKYFMPFATKLNSIKGLIAIRDAFIQIFPLTFVGSIVVCINVVLLSSTGFIGQFLVKIIPHLDEFSSYSFTCWNGTINLMAVFIVFLIARNMANQYHEDGLKGRFDSFGSILCFISAEGRRNVNRFLFRS